VTKSLRKTSRHGGNPIKKSDYKIL
jgi:hypothetical protein